MGQTGTPSALKPDCGPRLGRPVIAQLSAQDPTGNEKSGSEEEDRRGFGSSRRGIASARASIATADLGRIGSIRANGSGTDSPIRGRSKNVDREVGARVATGTLNEVARRDAGTRNLKGEGLNIRLVTGRSSAVGAVHPVQ